MPPGRFLKILLSGLFLVAVLFVAGVEYSSNQPSTYIQNYATYLQSAKDYFDFVQSSIVRVINWFGDLSHDEWLAGFTGILALSTIALWRATKRLVLGAEKTAERQLRAYVLVEGAKMTKDPIRNDGFGVAVTVKNFGQTPAHDMTECADIWVGAFPLAEPLPEHIWNNPSISVLAPGGYSIQIPTHSELTGLMQKAIFNNNTAVYVYGEINYLDAFDQLHTTKFRLMSVGQGLALGLFRQCQEGNSYT